MRPGRRSGSKKWLFQGVAFLHGRRGRAVFVSLAVLFPLALVVAARLDGTLVMRGDDKGLSQYYGFWAIFATTPLILLLTAKLVDRFATTLRSPSNYCVHLEGEATARLTRLIDRHIDSLRLKDRSAWILTFLVIVMIFWWMFNLISTIYPTPLRTFHHDVFDSSAHFFGFYVTRAYVFFVLVIVYAQAVFVSLHVTVSMISILKYLCRNEMLYVNLFHVDNCGGTSEFGKLNLLVLGIYAAFFTVISGMYITHRETYLVMVLSLMACSLLASAQSIAAVYYIHKTVAKTKRNCINLVTAQLNHHVASSLQGARFPNELLALRNHLAGMRTYPYSGGALIAVNVVRFAPALMGLFSLIRLLRGSG
jgi:hypothetical protein